MLNIHTTPLFSTWVKNVYSLCVEGVINSAHLSPTMNNHLLTTLNQRVKLSFSTASITSFTPSLYTANFPYFNLLNIHLYTLSTVPTIKKNKKK